MKSGKFGRFVRNLRMQLLLIFLANVVFLVMYRLFLKESVAEVVFRNQDPLNHPYYQAILDNLEFAGYLFSVVILLLILFYDHARSLVHYFAERETLFLGICLVLLASIQLCLIVFVQTVPISDSVVYIKLGNTLFTQHAYMSDAGTPTSFWPVGYPAFLAFLRFFTDNNILLAKLVNVGISVALVFVTFRVFRPWLNPQERIVFILVTAFLPNLIFSSNVLLTDYPFTLLLWLAVLIFLQKPHSPVWFAVIGLLFAAMSYLRPVALLLPIVFLASLWKDGVLRSHRLSLIVGALVFVGVISPWIIRNYSVFGTFVPMSTNGGFNFLMGNHRGASGGVEFEFMYDASNPHEAEESAKAFESGIRDIVSQPFHALLRLPRKLFGLFLRGDSSITWALKHTETNLDPRFVSTSFYFANVISYCLLYLSLLVLLFRIFDHQLYGPTVLFPVLYAYFIVFALLFVGSERYLIPIIPIHQFLCAKFISLRRNS